MISGATIPRFFSACIDLPAGRIQNSVHQTTKSQQPTGKAEAIEINKKIICSWAKPQVERNLAVVSSANGFV